MPDISELVNALHMCIQKDGTSCKGCPYFLGVFDDGVCAEKLADDISVKLKELEIFFEKDY